LGVLLGFLGCIVGFPYVNPTYGNCYDTIVGFPWVNPTNGNSIPINKGAEVKIIRYVA
jgi:hypothetical protein